MIRLLFGMIFAGAIIISTLSSCNKDDSLPVQTPGGNTDGNSSSGQITLSLVTNRWEAKADGIFVNVFSNIIPPAKPNPSVNVYLDLNGTDLLINSAIPFMGGQLWATNTQTDVGINFRGNLQNAPRLNIKIVIQ
jgi:hypothetical protein